MADGSLKVIRNKNIYTVDLTDAEDNVFHTLTFHLGDANFPIKILELYDDAFREMNKLEEQEEEIKKEILAEGVKEVPEIENITIENIKSREFELSPATRKFYYMEAEGYSKLREILDKFLGKGTCQAIFGDYNDKEEFADFLNGLLPEFEKMGVKIQNIQQNMYKKYAPKKNTVI
jgi:hypothetical protein